MTEQSKARLVEFSEIGLPVAPGLARVDALAYCTAASCILVRLATSAEGWRFFVRHVAENQYREILTLNPNTSFDRYLAVAEDATLAFVILLSQGADDPSVFALSLPDGKMTPLPKPSGYRSERIWISKLVGASADGSFIDVIAAEVSRRDDDGFPVIYSLARMTVSTGHLERIVELATPFA